MTKEELRKYRKIADEVRWLGERLEEMRQTMIVPSIPKLTGMPNGNEYHDKIAEAVQRYIDASQMYAEKLDELTAELYYIEACINSLEDPAERTLLHRRYIDGMKWENICVAMGYEWAQTHRIHAEALKHIAAIY